MKHNEIMSIINVLSFWETLSFNSSLPSGYFGTLTKKRKGD